MAKIMNEDSSVNIFIENELDGKKQVIKSSLNIPYAVDGKDKSLRIFNGDNSHALYASNRLGTLKANDSGYEVDVTDEDNLIGKRFELTDVSSKQVVLKGKVATKKSEAQIIDLPKMASAGK
jgi:hypothetical protein